MNNQQQFYGKLNTLPKSVVVPTTTKKCCSPYYHQKVL